MNELTTVNYADPHITKVLKHTVAQGATDAEFALFLEYCKSTKLNPFKKEIWFIKAGGRLQLMTGINGYWTIANSHPDFDGAECGMIDKDGNWVKSVGDNSFIGAWCRIYRKDRKYPMEGEAMMADYDSGFGLWKTKPRIMIKKVAESIALRKAFSQELNGLYTEEEMPAKFSAATVPDIESKPLAGKEYKDATMVLLKEQVVDGNTGEIITVVKPQKVERPKQDFTGGITFEQDDLPLSMEVSSETKVRNNGRK